MSENNGLTAQDLALIEIALFEYCNKASRLGCDMQINGLDGSFLIEQAVQSSCLLEKVKKIR